MTVRKKKKAAPRRRLSAEDAREAILTAAEKRLLASGPDALRLQEIAKDVGLGHPTLLHHIGSREALVSAVVARSMMALERDLIAGFTQHAGPPDVGTTVRHIDEVMRVRGHARLIGWLALTGAGGGPKEGSQIGDVAIALHAMRGASGDEAPFEDTAFGVILVSAALFGVALLGSDLLKMLRLPDDEATLRRFREWFAALLMEHARTPMT